MEKGDRVTYPPTGKKGTIVRKEKWRPNGKWRGDWDIVIDFDHLDLNRRYLESRLEHLEDYDGV